MSGRRGFTLLEMMIASTVFVLVVGGTISAFIGVQRLTRTALAEAELSVRMRELRDKLLFHAAPPHDGRVWSGVLSGSHSGSVVEGGRKILMSRACGYDVASRTAVDQSIELVPVQTGDLRFFGNDADRHDEQAETRWLDPGGFSWLPEADILDVRTRDQSGEDMAYLFYINLRASVNGVTRGERVTVPVFGMAQETLSGRVIDD